MMKNSSVLLSLIVCLSFVGCKGNNPAPSTPPKAFQPSPLPLPLYSSRPGRPFSSRPTPASPSALPRSTTPSSYSGPSNSQYPSSSYSSYPTTGYSSYPTPGYSSYPAMSYSHFGQHQSSTLNLGSSVSPAGAGYAVPGPGPGAGLVLPATRPSPQFERGYVGSEAEEYRRYYNQRHDHNMDFHRVIQLGGDAVDASRYDMDAASDYEAGYTIYSQQLATTLTRLMGRAININDSLRESELRAHPGDDVGESTLDVVAGSDHRFGGALNDYEMVAQAFPVGDFSALSSGAQRYLDFLREVISNKIRDLDASLQARYSQVLGRNYYHNPEYPSVSGIYVHNPADPVYQYTGTLFYNILDAVANNSENQFLQNIINTATAFHPNSIQARNGFIETYTFLYVAKRFPSVGVRQRYVHYTLNCGGLY